MTSRLSSVTLGGTPPPERPALRDENENGQESEEIEWLGSSPLKKKDKGKRRATEAEIESWEREAKRARVLVEVSRGVLD
jgi:hypothetical protein